MPTEPLYAKIYIKATPASDWTTLKNVTDHQICVIKIHTGTYRDQPSPANGLLNAPAAGSAAVLSALPVIGLEGATPAVSIAGIVAQTRMFASDDAAHVKPRYYNKLETCHVLALNSKAIPAPAAPLVKSKVFTGAVNDECSSVANTFANGDLVTVQSSVSTGLPAGLLSGPIYTFVKIDDDKFKLMLNGAVVKITTTGIGSAVHTVTLVQPITFDANIVGLFVYPIANKPEFSFDLPS